MDEIPIYNLPALAEVSESAHPAPQVPPSVYLQHRRHPRMRCFLAVQLRPADDHSLMIAKLSDVSLGGCGIESPTAIQAGTKLAICPLASDGTVWVQGTVVNVRFAEGMAGYQIGVRFPESDVAGSPQSLAKFVQFVEEASSKQGVSNAYLNHVNREKI